MMRAARESRTCRSGLQMTKRVNKSEVVGTSEKPGCFTTRGGFTLPRLEMPSQPTWLPRGGRADGYLGVSAVFSLWAHAPNFEGNVL